MSRSGFTSESARRHTASVKWDRYGGRDVLPLWVADMDFPAPPAVVEALQRRVEHGVFGYTHATDSLAEVFRDYALSRHGWAVEPEWLVWLPGSVPALHAACRLIEPAHRVVTTTPIYPPFLAAPAHMERGLFEVPMLIDDNGRQSFDLDALEQAFDDGGRLFYLCNPYNPGGRVFSSAELKAIAERALAHDTLVVADELHADLVLEPGLAHQPFGALSSELAAHTITLMAPSKTFNLAGLGLACAVIPDPALRKRFQAAIDGVLPYVNALAYAAAEAAYRDGWAWHGELIDYLRGNRDRVTEVLAELPGIRAVAPEGTYLYWMDLRETGIENPARHLENHGLGLSDGTEFGAPGFVRLNFACSRNTLDEALVRFKTALTSL
ncbi:MAG: MalY/PatB family protein [Gammaproteobacteria bacterium]